MTEWEPVQLSELHSTDRLPVPGGWLYRVRHHTLRFDAQSVVFVPAPPPTAVSRTISNTEYAALVAAGVQFE